jgi:hypothetical protein
MFSIQELSIPDPLYRERDSHPQRAISLLALSSGAHRLTRSSLSFPPHPPSTTTKNQLYSYQTIEPAVRNNPPHEKPSPVSIQDIKLLAEKSPCPSCLEGGSRRSRVFPVQPGPRAGMVRAYYRCSQIGTFIWETARSRIDLCRADYRRKTQERNFLLSLHLSDSREARPDSLQHEDNKFNSAICCRRFASKR